MSRTERKRNLIGAVMLALVVVLLGVLIFQNYLTTTQRDSAQSLAATSAQQKKNLAEEVADACQSGRVVMSSAGVDLCDRAATIAQQPVPVAGPAGPRGLPGADGKDGAPGATGKTGAAGKDGADGNGGLPGVQGVPGPTGLTGVPGLTGLTGTTGEPGQAGAPGADGSTGPPGPAGPAGPAGDTGETGPTGAAGIPGKDGATGTAGRGITDVQCVGDGDASYWQITYTDGTTAQSSGPCKVTTTPPTEPTP